MMLRELKEIIKDLPDDTLIEVLKSDGNTEYVMNIWVDIIDNEKVVVIVPN
jgi:hypothetical protein